MLSIEDTSETPPNSENSRDVDYAPSKRYPNPLLTDVRAISETLAKRDGARWWVAQTRPRFEKRFASALFDLRIESFLPLTRKVYRKPNGHRNGYESEVPLFPTYVFLAGDDYACYDARQTGYLLNLIKVSDQKTLIDELASLQIALGVNPELGRQPLPALGAKVEVIAGPFRGMIGYVDSHGPRGRLFLAITILGEGTPVDIPAEFVEAA